MGTPLTEQERDALLQRIDATLTGHGERLEKLEALPGAVEALRSEVEALRTDVNALGHNTRAETDEVCAIMKAMPVAVAKEVDRTFGTEQRSLRADVEALKEAAAS